MLKYFQLAAKENCEILYSIKFLYISVQPSKWRPLNNEDIVNLYLNIYLTAGIKLFDQDRFGHLTGVSHLNDELTTQKPRLESNSFLPGQSRLIKN